MLTEPDLTQWETFWTRLEREYRAVCEELDADPDTIDLDAFTDGLDRLAHEQAAITA